MGTRSIAGLLALALIMTLTGPNCGTSASKDTSERSASSKIALLDRLPDTRREVLHDENGYFTEEDCFCSQRIFALSKLDKTVKAYTWCGFADHPRDNPDFGEYRISQSWPDSLRLEAVSSHDGTPACFNVTIGLDSIVVVETYDKSRAGCYRQNKMDCTDFKG